MTTLATVDDFKIYAGITTANTDALITMLLASSLTMLSNYCNRALQSAQYTEYRDGNDSSRMLVAAGYPLTAFSSLSIDGRVIPTSTNGSPGYFFVLGGRAVVLIGYKFTRGYRNIVMTYTGGYGDDNDVLPWPADLNLALMMCVQTRLKERDRLGVGSKSLAGESITFTDSGSGTSGQSGGIPAGAATILKNYMNTVPENGQ